MRMSHSPGFCVTQKWDRGQIVDRADAAIGESFYRHNGPEVCPSDLIRTDVGPADLGHVG